MLTPSAGGDVDEDETKSASSRWSCFPNVMAKNYFLQFYGRLRKSSKMKKVLSCALISAYFCWHWCDDLLTLECLTLAPWSTSGPRNCLHKLLSILLMGWSGVWCAWMLVNESFGAATEQPNHENEFNNAQEHLQSAHKQSVDVFSDFCEMELEVLKTMAESNKVLEDVVLEKLCSSGEDEKVRRAEKLKDIFKDAFQEPEWFMSEHIKAWSEHTEDPVKEGDASKAQCPWTWCDSCCCFGTPKAKLDECEPPFRQVAKPISKVFDHIEHLKGDLHVVLEKVDLGNGWLSWGKLPEGKEVTSSREKCLQKNKFYFESPEGSFLEHAILLFKKWSCSCCRPFCWLDSILVVREEIHPDEEEGDEEAPASGPPLWSPINSQSIFSTADEEQKKEAFISTLMFPMQYSCGCRCWKKTSCWVRIHTWNHAFFIANGLWACCWILWFFRELNSLYQNLFWDHPPTQSNSTRQDAPSKEDYSCRPDHDSSVMEVRCGWVMFRYFIDLGILLFYVWCWKGVLSQLHKIDVCVKLYCTQLAVDILEDQAEHLADAMYVTAPLSFTMCEIQRNFNRRSKLLTDALREGGGDFSELQEKLEELRKDIEKQKQGHRNEVRKKLTRRKMQKAELKELKNPNSQDQQNPQVLYPTLLSSRDALPSKRVAAVQPPDPLAKGSRRVSVSRQTVQHLAPQLASDLEIRASRRNSVTIMR